VSSEGHYQSSGLKWDKWINNRETGTLSTFARYCDSKWCQVAFVIELQERLKDTVHCWICC